MSFSYLAKERMDLADLETFEDGDAIHLRKKSTQETFDLKEETRRFMELFERGVEIRSQWQHKGFWGTGLRNDGKRCEYNIPQGTEDYEYNKRVGNGEPTIDPWPRMYTEAWLNA